MHPRIPAGGQEHSQLSDGHAPNASSLAARRLENARRKATTRQIIDRVSAAIGEEFFETLVKNLGEGLGADCLYVGEFAGGKAERIRTLAAFVSGARRCRTDYLLAGSAAALVSTGEPWSCTRGVLKKVPGDELLAEIGAQACVAVPLLDRQNRGLGAIMAIYQRPLPSARESKSMLETFAPRAAAELRRKQADAALRESEQRYQVFISQNADALWRVEFEQPIPTSAPEDEQIAQIYRCGYMAECNDAMARLLGYSHASQMIGMGFEELAKHAHPRLQEELRCAIRSGYRFDTVESVPVELDGRIRYLVRSQWGIVENGALQRVWGAIRDITELKRVEEALRASEQRLSELLENTHLLTVMLDLEGSISFCNDYLLRLTGWRADEIAGQSWFDRMVPPEERDKAREEFASARRDASNPHHFEGVLLGKDGQRWLVAWENTIWRDSRGQVAGLASVGRDITAVKALEAQVAQSHKLEGIQRSVTRMVNDFNGLLTVISGYCTILLQSKTETDAEHAPLIEIQNAAQAGTALTEQLIAFTSQQTLHPELLDLNAVAKAVARKVESLLPSNIALQLDLDPTLAKVRADSSQLGGVLLSMAMNAIEAMPDGGRLSIYSTNIEVDEEQASHTPGLAPGLYVLLTVADTGVGMSEDVRDHLFEPFFSTKDSARGLGLPAIYGIVQQSGGHIAVESEPGAGATFQIYLPFADAEQ
jgi:hypothetical protein